MLARGQNFKESIINIVGSSVFGRYPKINIEKTYNMFISDNFLILYAGYGIVVVSSMFGSGTEGRAIFTSTKFDELIIVINNNVYGVKLTYNQLTQQVQFTSIALLGQLHTYTGIVYITENNKPQICISDNTYLYIYDPTQNPVFSTVTGLNFTPGYVTFHDTYFICAASNDTTTGVAVNNSWRLSNSNNGLTGNWPSSSAKVGYLQTKPDNTQAVVRFPSKGNMIFVMGSIVTEAWFDTGAQLFPYQRANQFNIDYGCVSPATVAYMDEKVVWLAQNEKSGPVIMYSDGGMPRRITTDGIDYMFAQLQNPQDSQAFLYRQDGHVFYHINFYSDNLSLFYDFSTDKFYHASDQNLNYFIAAEIAFYRNQYYFVTRNNGNLFAFDTTFTTYEDVDSLGNEHIYEIPRIRSCRNIRLPSQEYFVINDVGFTIESGETDYTQQFTGPLYLVTQSENPLVTQGSELNLLITQDGQYLVSQNDNSFITQQESVAESYNLICQQMGQLPLYQETPAVDLSISRDGGATFGNEFRYWLPGIGQRKNKLVWWQCGIANDAVLQFKFWNIGRVVCTDGVANLRI